MDNGVIMPKLEYPVEFKDGLLGFRAKEDIKQMEMIIAVPYKMAINIHTAMSDPNISKIVTENPELFGS